MRMKPSDKRSASFMRFQTEFPTAHIRIHWDWLIDMTDVTSPTKAIEKLSVHWVDSLTQLKLHCNHLFSFRRTEPIVISFR